jgi:hypothetical protein
MPLLRQNLFDGEDAYFKSKPDVTGMATEDGRVILNPYSKLSEQERGSVYKNEASRLHMRSNGTPGFSLTQKQADFLDGNAYKDASDDDRRQTILARIISGDASAQDYTDEQLSHANTIRKAMDSAEYLSAFKDATE